MLNGKNCLYNTDSFFILILSHPEVVMQKNNYFKTKQKFINDTFTPSLLSVEESQYHNIDSIW